MENSPLQTQEESISDDSFGNNTAFSRSPGLAATSTTTVVNNLSDKKTYEDIQKKFHDMNSVINDLQASNTSLRNTLNLFCTKFVELEKKVKINENYMVNLDMYSRRPNVEFCNIPENVSQNQLETYIITMLNSLNLELESFDIVAVHRIGKYRNGNKPRNVIVRFLNRRHAYDCLKMNKKLKSTQKYKSIFVIENLCPYSKRIFNALYKLKKINKIKSLWTFNGQVFYKISEEDDTYFQARQLEDIQFLFDDDMNSFENDFNFSTSNV